MSNVVAMPVLAPRAPAYLNASQLALVRRTVAADTTQDEFDLFIEVCRRVGLDPFRKQIHCIVYNKNKPDKRRVVFITGIDGFRGVAARCKDYRPDDEEPAITFDEAEKNDATNPLGIVKAVVKAYKLGPDGWHAVVGTAYWEEFAPITEIWAEDDNGKRRPSGKFELDRKGNWGRMPRLMLGKCAEAQALRKGWPESLSGIYTPEEMEGATVESASAAVAQHEEQVRLARVNARDAIAIQWSAGQPIEAVPVGQLGDRVGAFLHAAESPTQIGVWRNTNAAGLREFWARSPGDALELKKMIEKREAELSA